MSACCTRPQTKIACVAGVREKRRERGHDDVKLVFIDVKKVGKHAKLKSWLHGVRKAASGWEDDYDRRLVNDGFQRGIAASTIFFHPQSLMRGVVHGHDLTFAAPKVRGILGSGPRDVRETEMCGGARRGKRKGWRTKQVRRRWKVWV